MAAPMSVDIMKQMRDRLLDELKVIDGAYERTKRDSEKKLSADRAEVEKQEKIIEQMEHLLNNLEDGEATLSASWAIHGEPGKIPLCVVECSECDNSEIDKIQKSIIEQEIRELKDSLSEFESQKADNEALLASSEKSVSAFVLDLNEKKDNRTAKKNEIADDEKLVDKLENEVEETRGAESKAKEDYETFVEKSNESLKVWAGEISTNNSAMDVLLRDPNIKNCERDPDGYPIGDAGSTCQTIGDQVRVLDKQNKENESLTSELQGNMAEAEKLRIEEAASNASFINDSEETIDAKRKNIKALTADVVVLDEQIDEIEESLEKEAKQQKEINTILNNLEKAMSQDKKDIADAQKFLSKIESDCDECGTWRIIRAGTENSEEGPDCLLGWEYSEDGDILIDEARLANNIRFISLYNKPDTLLIDKRGDVWADGEKIARVAVSGIVDRWFDNFSDPALPQLTINPRFIGNNRIFHVMQDGFHIVCEKPNSLRDELARHELIPFHVGDYFVNRAKHCDDHEEGEHHEEDCKIECCGPPELPDCFDIGDCPVTIPEWFKEWYGVHQDNLYLKLPYDKRYEGDPMRYTHEGQILFSNALVDLVVRYFNSTPLEVENGFDDWFVDRGLNRILNILPLIYKNSPPRSRFSLSNWTFGTNSNSPRLALPADSSIGECVECCELIDSSCALMLTFDDCCEFACGRWSADCSYNEGDIVIGKSGEACYEAMVDICAGDCNPEPGKAVETIWRKCSIDCENDSPSCEFVISDQFLCDDKDCDARVKVGALYELNQAQCEYVWTFTARNVYDMAQDVVVESFGHAPGEVYDENNNIVIASVPLLSVDCVDSSTQDFNPNTWIFTLEARATESNKVLASCQSEEKELELSCGFSVSVWDGMEAALAEAYNWCDEKTPDNPSGRRAAAPSSPIAEIYTNFEQSYEQFLALIDTPPTSGLSAANRTSKFNSIIGKAEDVINAINSNYGLDVDSELALVNSAIESVRAGDTDGAQKKLADIVSGIINIIDENEIYVGVGDCCCIMVKADENDQAVCDLSWVWLVRSDPNDKFVPYYGGVGLKPAESVLCVERNPDQYNVTNAEVMLVSYAASCDDIVRARIEGWDGTTSWNSVQDGFNAIPVCECLRQQSLTCPCEPRGGIANLILGECDIDKHTEFPIELSHVNPFNECTVKWIWQVSRTDGTPVEHQAGTGIVANPKSLVLASGVNYEIMLRWLSEDETRGGIAWQQTYETPVCPVLDLTFDKGFTEVEYGTITTQTTKDIAMAENLPDNLVGRLLDPYAGIENQYWFVDEADSYSETPDRFYLSTADSNPYGKFRILAQHTPNMEDPHWLAVNHDEYRWQWYVVVKDPDGTVVTEFGTSPLTSINGKAPDFTSSDLQYHAPDSLNYVYEISLRALHAETSQLAEENITSDTNDAHKGKRTIEKIAAVDSGDDDYYSITIGTLNGETTAYARQIDYRPMLNCTGMREQKYSIRVRYADGSTETFSNYMIRFSVLGDPCEITNTACTDIQVHSAPDSVAAGENIVVVYDAILQTDLNDECGELTNPNTVIIHSLRDSDEAAVDFELVEEFVTTDDSTGQDVLNARIRFTCEYVPDESPGSDYSPESEYTLVDFEPISSASFAKTLEYKVVVASSDDCDLTKLDSSEGDWAPIYVFSYYDQCWDGSYINTDSESEVACPCEPIKLNETLFGDDTVYSLRPIVGVNGVAGAGNKVHVLLSDFVDGYDSQNYLDARYFVSQTSSSTNFALSHAYGSVTIEATTTEDGVEETISMDVKVFDGNKFASLTEAEAGGDNCVKTFTLNLLMKTGCGSNVSAANYFGGANIGNANTDVQLSDPQPVCVCNEISYPAHTAIKANILASDGTSAAAIIGANNPDATIEGHLLLAHSGEITTGNLAADGAIPLTTIRLTNGFFGCNDSQAKQGNGTIFPGTGNLEIDLADLFEDLYINNENLVFKSWVGPNANQQCGEYLGEGDKLQIEFGNNKRSSLNQTPVFAGSNATFNPTAIDASNCELGSEWNVLFTNPEYTDYRNTVKTSASAGAVHYLVQAQDPACPDAIRHILIKFQIDPQVLSASCRQETNGLSACVEDIAGHIHNPDLCCDDVSLIETPDVNNLVNYDNAANLNSDNVEVSTTSGTYDGTAYDILIKVKDGAFKLDTTTHSHYIKLYMNHLFSRTSDESTIRYDFTVGANSSSATPETGSWSNGGGNEVFKIRVGKRTNNASTYNYRHSVLDAGDPVNGKEIFVAEYPKVVYTVKATNTDCTTCTVESEIATILVVTEDQTRCVAPVVVDQSTRDTIAATLAASASTDSVDGPVIDVTKLQSVASGVTGVPFKVGGVSVLVDTFGVRIKNEFITIPDSWVESAQGGEMLNDGTGGVKFNASMDLSELFQEGTVGDDTTYVLATYNWNGTEYDLAANNVTQEDDPLSMELGWHSERSQFVSRIRGTLDGSNWKGYLSGGGTTNDIKNYRALLITASNPDCDEVARIAMYMRLDNQVREGVVGCTDDAATNTDTGAVIDDGSCCYVVNHKSEYTIKDNIQAIIDDADTTLTGMDKSLIDAGVQGDRLLRIYLNNGAWDLPTSAGGIVTIPMSALFDFPNGDDGSESNYVYSGTCTANSIFDALDPDTSDVAENFDDATLRYGGTPHFKIRLGQTGGNASYARHKLTDVSYSGITTVGNEERSTASWTAKNQNPDVEYKITVKLYDDNGNFCSEDHVKVRVRSVTQTFPAGCMDSEAFNYYPSAVVENPQISCEPVVEGCKDPDYCEYDPDANTTNNSLCVTEKHCCPYLWYLGSTADTVNPTGGTPTNFPNFLRRPEGYPINVGDDKNVPTDWYHQQFYQLINGNEKYMPAFLGGFGFYSPAQQFPTAHKWGVQSNPTADAQTPKSAWYPDDHMDPPTLRNDIEFWTAGVLPSGISGLYGHQYGIKIANDAGDALAALNQAGRRQIADVNISPSFDIGFNGYYPVIGPGDDVGTRIAWEIVILQYWLFTCSLLNDQAMKDAGLPCDFVKRAIEQFAGRMTLYKQLMCYLDFTSRDLIIGGIREQTDFGEDGVTKVLGILNTVKEYGEIVNWTVDEDEIRDLYLNSQTWTYRSCNPCIDTDVDEGTFEQRLAMRNYLEAFIASMNDDS